ncbi:uncharacterized protein LOC105789490 [Gossypium raimondii]|uniref:uncharacterized protein LOC105789490 n=1 Tax=Gossypium raimondii TaxID=29730 RepID=UPI00063A9506|nr:uncharacterized protein LOC105789490 [Gossypium raimondii]
MFTCTNNVAEYEACILALQIAIEKKVMVLKVFGDSTLVLYQFRGEWETRDSKLIHYKTYVQFCNLPREENQLVDALATLAAMFKVGSKTKVQPILLKVKDSMTHCTGVKLRTNGKPWYVDIKQYLQYQQYSDFTLENDKQIIRRLAMGFFLDAEFLYKRGHDQTLLRCVDTEEANQIMKEIHNGICGAHNNGHMMARQIMRAGYFWLTLE